MIYERIKSGGIAHVSYLVAQGGQAAVIDPRRDCHVYVERAGQLGVHITHIFETHRNEDYLAGSVELAALTDAPVYHGPGLQWGYGNTLHDGQEFRIGSLLLATVHTPGHTDESTCYALTDLSSGDAPVLLFSGDTIFVDDVGRTDLYGSAQVERLAAAMYDSIFRKLLPLGDGVILCPAHGAGSVCGLNIGSRDDTTIGTERRQNPTLQAHSREEFVAARVAEKPERPPYFGRMEQLNLQGLPPLGHAITPPLQPGELRQALQRGALLVDTREPPAFGGAHIAGSYSIWLEGLAPFAGWVLPYDRPILLVMEEPAHLDQALKSLLRLGYDNTVGYLRGGMEAWYRTGLPTAHLGLLTVQELKARLDAGERLTVLDTRSEDEWKAGHVPGAIHIFAGHISAGHAEIPRDRPVAVLCSVGHRSGLAASLLLRHGHGDTHNVLGGMTAWKAAGYPISV